MTAELAVSRWGRYPLSRIVPCIGFFVVANLLLIGRAWFLAGDWLIVATALPLSQCSLVALWAVTSRASIHLRFFLPPITVVVSWFVLKKLVSWGIGDPASAAWASALAVQTLTIVTGVKLYQAAIVTRSPNQSRFTFDLRTIILWTTVMAVAFAFVRFGGEKYQWTTSVIEWELFGAIQLVGAFNGLVAVLWTWAFSSANRRIAKYVIVLLVLGLSGILLTLTANWMTGAPPISIVQTLGFGATQSVLVVCSLAIVLWHD